MEHQKWPSLWTHNSVSINATQEEMTSDFKSIFVIINKKHDTMIVPNIVATTSP